MFCSKCGNGLTPEARFCSHCGTAVASNRENASLPHGVPPEWESLGSLSRRQVTVLFCDLVNSTVMAERMDPEDMFYALASYHGLVKAIATRFGGHIDKIVGDGVDLFFGYPLASEEDSASAIHAAMAIVDQVGTLQGADGRPLGLQVRIGIATGRVAVGNMAHVSIAGSTPNLAARIQAELRPGQIGVSASTRRVAGDVFQYTDIGAFRLKGFADEVSISLVVGSKGILGRSAFRRQMPGTPMIGREAALDQIRAGWDEALRSPTPAVLILGEAGLGKSRLTRAFMESLSNQPHLCIRLQCSPFYTNSALYPFVQHLVEAAGFTTDDSAIAQAEKLEAQLAIAGIQAPEDLALIAALLDVRVERRYVELTMPPPARMQMTEEVLLRYFSALAQMVPSSPNESVLIHYLQGVARGKPLVLIIEDLHWIDPSSLELLEKLLGNSRLSQALLVMTARPGFQHAFAREELVWRIALEPLNEDSSRRLIESLVTEVALPPQAVDVILRKTDGVPLYIEELTRVMQDASAVRPLNDGLTAPEIPVPDTLADLLAERLDRLGPAKRLAQTAAVLGQTFQRDLLQACAGETPDSFDAHLQSVFDANLFIDVSPSELGFRHALVQSAAYDSLLLRTRVQLHARVAECLTGSFAGLAHRAPEFLAHHLARADRSLEASRYLLQAGIQSLQSGAPREAAEHLRGGLACLKDVADSAARSESELGLLSVLGPTTMVLLGPGSSEFGEVQLQAYSLSQRLPGKPRLFPVTYGLSLHYWGRARLEEAWTLASELLQEAQSRSDDEALMASANMAGMISLHRGRPVAAREFLSRSVERYRPERDAALYPVYLMDFGVFGRFYLALATFMCGDPETARRHALDAYELAGRLNQPHSMGFSMLANFNIAALRDEPAVAQQFADQCIDFSSRFGFPEFVGMARIVRGWATARLGHPLEGLNDLDIGVAQWKRTGFENWQSWFTCLRVRVLRLLGRDLEAEADIQTQLLRVDHNGEQLFVPILLGHQATLLAARGHRDACDQVAARARALAAEQGAQSTLAWLEREVPA